MRWLGNRKEIEEDTTTWDKVIVDRQGELFEWVKLLKKVRERRITILAFANNHYAGHGTREPPLKALTLLVLILAGALAARCLVGVGKCRWENPCDATTRAFRIVAGYGDRHRYAHTIRPYDIFKPITRVADVAPEAYGNVCVCGVSATATVSCALVTYAVEDISDCVALLHRFAPAQPQLDCCEDKGFFWDVAILYPPHARWNDMPVSDFWNGPVWRIIPLEKAMGN